MENLTTIKQVKQEVAESEFYQLIADGWVLLHVYSQLTRDNRADVFYVMGHEEPIKETESRYQEIMSKLIEKSKV